MEIEQSVLENLPINQRQKVCRQIRQQQIKNYLDFQKVELAKGKKDKKKNKKGTSVTFGKNYVLQDAVENFNDREVLSLLKSGADSRFTTGNGITLLHKCCAEDNASIAEILISQGIDVNCRDDDLWAPLHTACSCESLEVMQLLLKNKADATLLDVDGYFPHEHAPEGSEARHLMEAHLSQIGMDPTKLKELRLDLPRQMLNEIKNLLASGVDMNALNSNGISLLHISSANGYKQVMKVLLQNFKTDVNVVDIRGWTPLHVAAKFDQVKAVKLLLKHKANPNAVDGFGLKPSAITNSDEIRGLLLKAEQRVTKGEVKIEKTEDEEDAADEAEQKTAVQIIRVNSKTMKNKRGSFGKEDKLMEAMMMYATIQDDGGDNYYESVKEEEKANEDYVSAIWKAASSEQGDLPFCMENDNLANVGDIKEETILTEIQKRYSKSQIYTLVCDVLIAVNPFKDLPYYGKTISMKYHNGEASYQLPPHIYISAESAYQNLLHAQNSQCCVISGESGSGKTESCKFIVQHLLRIAGSDETNLNSKINKMNPLLEAFGNAKTVMNDNSSRFAKFMELFFTSNGKVMGARILQYLLEKSRIIYQGKGECNFHIFYWMMSGLSPEEFNVYNLRKDGKHRYLQPRGGADVSQQFNKDNKAKFWEVKECFKFIGFSQDDIQCILQVLSIVLHLGDISFHGVGNNDAAQVSNPVMLQTVADMLEVSAEELGSALVAEYTVTRGEQIKKERTLQQAEDCRDALAKTLYGHLFSWIVNGMNQLLQPEEESDCLQIGLLDIFGFENFPRNSFEQLCINLANEQLQLFTNDHVFHKEQQECLLEGVPLVKIDLTSNQNVLDLFLERHTGVLDILDEESTFPKATDKSLAAKLHKIPGKTYPALYKTPRDEGPTFTVVHYAGSVTYELVGFLDKNRDTLPNAVLCTMKASNKLLIKEFFQSKITRTGSLAPSARQQRMSRCTTKKATSPFEFFKKLRGGKQEEMKPKVASHRKGPSTVAHYFQNSLTELVNKIQSAEPHFIRCIKPNTSKAAMLFDSQYILSQLRYTGVADIVQIRKFGYPLRLTFHEFQTRYKILSICALPQFRPMTDIEKCKQVLQKYRITDYKVGKTKLFFSHWHVLELEKLTTNLDKKVITAQSVVRGFLSRHRCKTLFQTHTQQKGIIASFLHQVELQSQKVEKWMIAGVQVDKENYDLSLKQKEIAEITKSLESLDDLLNTYEEIHPVDSKVQQTTSHDKADEYENTPSQTKTDEDDNVYDDAASVWINQGQEAVRINDDLDHTEESMNGHMQHRTLPPPPPSHVQDSILPPSPKEMYGGTYASIEDEQMNTPRKTKPPPPQRSPNTRLSTTSDTSFSFNTYEELPNDMVFDDHTHSATQVPHASLPQDKVYQYQQQQQSPSYGACKPFSYLPSAQSPKFPRQSQGDSHGDNVYEDFSEDGNQNTLMGRLDSQDMNGHTNKAVGRNPPNPAVAYGKHESVFQPQPHRPPPKGPPPPPPPGEPGQYSPKPQRHSECIDSGKRPSPALQKKNSGRSYSVPCVEGELSPYKTHLPAPPPPVSVKENYLAAALEATRPPSPPLPPPPPELQRSSDLPPPSVSVLASSAQSVHPPAPPPISTIPTNKDRVSKSSAKDQDPVSPSAKGLNSPSPDVSRGGNMRQSPAVPVVPKKISEHSDQLVKELQTVHLTKTDKTGSPQISPEKEFLEKEQEVANVLVGVKLKPSGVKLWEKQEKTEVSPTAVVPPVNMTDSMDDLPPPPPPADFDTSYLSHVLDEPVPIPLEKKIELFSNKNKEEQPWNKNKKGNLKSFGKADSPFGKKGTTSSMDINNIDLSQVPGYTPITPHTPIWKKDVIEKKNKEKIQEYLENLRKQKEEAEKWKGVPEWKRKLVLEKEKQKVQTVEEKQKEAAAAEAERKRQTKEAEEKRKEMLRQQEEERRQMEQELQDAPAWKREIMMKRGGAIRNWGDEREEINKDGQH